MSKSNVVTKKRAVFTIVSKNYLHFARVLMDSLRTAHPDWSQYVLLVDRIDDDFDPKGDHFTVVQVSDLPLPDMEKFLFRYTILEINTAVKPFMFEWLFLSERFDQVVYLDPDIYVYREMLEVVNTLDEGNLMVLTPHLTAQLEDDKKPSELDILNCGTFNLGFIALANHEFLHRFLKWWESKLEFECVVDISKGIFVDQKWMDLVPSLFPQVCVLRNEGYNIAYWNIKHRHVSSKGTQFLVNHVPLTFFHFSGLNPKSPDELSKHQNRFRLKDLGEVEGLVRQYCDRLFARGLESFEKLNYAFDYFEDGTRIVPDMRIYYRQHAEAQKALGHNPFRSGAAYFNSLWGHTPYGEPSITMLMRAVWERRQDLQVTFPDLTKTHRASYAYWFVDRASDEHGISDEFIEPIRATLSSPSSPVIQARAQFSLADKVKTRFVTSVLDTAVILDPIIRRFPYSLRQRIKGRIRSLIPTTGNSASGASIADFRGNFSGFHEMSEYDRENGATWMAPSARVKLQKPALGNLKVVGEYYPDMIQRAHNSSSLTVDVLLNDSLVEKIHLHEPGLFERTIQLQPIVTNHAAVLRFEADRSFTPRDLGLNEDPRELSVRISKITLNEKDVLDFSMPDDPYVLQEVEDLDIGLNIVGYLSKETGVGESARLCCGVAETMKIPFAVYDFAVGCPTRDAAHPWATKVSKANPHKVNLFHINADQTLVSRTTLGEEFFAGHYNIGYWHWELSEFPERWRSSFDCLDEIWVPSQFVMDAVSTKAPIPVVKIPHAVHFDLGVPMTRKQFGLPEKGFLFLMMYDMYSHQPRKNPSAVIEAYRRAFSQASEVALVVKTQNIADHPKEYEELRCLLQGIRNVHLIDQPLRRDEIYNLENLCDCYVSLHRSEGFGFGPAESMYLGKPVIATNYSGNVDFMNAKNSCPVDYQLVTLEKNHGPYQKGQSWADPDIDHAVYFMKKVVTDSQWRNKIGLAAEQTIRTMLSPDVIGKMYRRRLELISRW